MSALRLLFFFLFFVPLCSAQEQDFGTWISAEVNHKITTRWQLSVAEQVRLNRNLETIDLLFTQLGGQFLIKKKS
jgi:hypothetical protein